MKRAGKKLIAFTLCALMIFTTLFGDVSFSYAEEENMNAGEEMGISAEHLSTQTDVVANLAVAADEPAPEQFSDIVTSSTVSKTTGIKMTDSLKIELTFKLPEDVVGGWLLEEHYIYEYDINAIEAVNQSDNTAAAALIAQTSTSEPLPVIMDGVNVGTYTIVNGKVTINFKNGLEYLKRSDISRVGTFEFQCGLEEDAFADDGGTYTLKFSSASTAVNPTISTDAKDVIKAGVKVEKSNAVFDEATKTAKYTITVDNVSGDYIHNLVVNDTMGTYLTYDSIETDGITVDSTDPRDVKFTIATVPEGVTTFTYVCKVDDGAFLNANSQGGNSSGLNNSITAKVNDKDIYIDNSSTKKQDTRFDIKKDIVAKSSAVEKDTNGNDVIRWTIYINRGATEFDLNGYTFSDTLETGLTVDTESVSVTGDNQNIKQGLIDAIKNGASYIFPEGSTGEYVISYVTTVPEHEGLASYTNTAKISDGPHIDIATATSPEIGSALANKQAGTPYVDDVEGSVSEGELIIPWTTTITIPQGPVTELVYKDFMYGWYGENGKGFVTGSDGVFNITLDDSVSLVEGTDYNVTGSGLERTITFTPDCLNRVGGKTITIAYKTIGNYKDRTYNDGNNTYTNRYELKYNFITETGSASVIKPKEKPVSPDSFIDKSVSGYNEDKHTITWKITVKAGETCNIKDLILEDTIEGMEYWGYNGIECSATDAYVYIQDSSYMTFQYPMKVEDISSGGTPKYKFTIDFTDDSLSLTKIEAWGDSSTWLNKNSFDKEFNIYYTTKVCGDKLLYNNTTTYSNSVDATATINDAASPTTDNSSASKEIETKVLTKECTQNAIDGANVLTYVINVNPDGLKLNPSATQGFYTVEDTMPSNQIWVNDVAKTVLKNSKTGETLTRVNSADTVKAAGAGNNIYHVSYINNVLTFTVPDEVPITIEYKVTMLSDSNQGNLSYVNTVLLAEPYVGNQSVVENRENRRVASSSMTMVGSRLFETSKVDALDTTKYLSGATFEAVEYSWNEATNIWEASGNTYNVTTDSTGRVWDSSYTRLDSSTGTDTLISKNKYYVITEKNAPYGYELSDQVYKVIVVDVNAISSNALSKLPSDVYRITAGTELIFSDMPSQNLPENELVINKKYYKADGVTEADTMPATNAELLVYEGDLTLADCESEMYTPLPTGTIEGNFTYENINNKITLKEIPDGDYTIYEKTAPDGYDRLNTVYHFKVTDHKISWEGETAEYKPSEKTIKNKQTFDNSITINKRYFKAADVSKSSPLTVIPENAVFTCTKTHEPDGNGGYTAVNGTAELMTTTDGGFTYTLSKLSAGKYEIKENVSDIYNTDSALPLTVEVSAIGTMTITDNSGNPVQLVSGETLIHREITVDNVIKDNSFSINKTYYDESGNLIEAFNIPETVAGAVQQKVIFNLLKWNGTGDKSVKSSYMAAVINSDYADYHLEKAAAAGEADKYVWRNIEPGYYMAEEVLKTGDNTDYEALATVFFYVDANYMVHVNNEATGSYDGTADVKNRKVNGAICRFYLEKMLANQSGTVETLVDTLPADISFTLTRDSDSTPVQFEYNSTKARWEATGLTAGSYTVQETGHRVGYKAAETIKFTIQQKQSGDGLEISQIKYGGNAPNTNTEDFRTSTIVEDGMETMVATLVNRPEDNKLTLTKRYLQPNPLIPASHATNAVFTVYKENGVITNVVGNMETTDGETYTISNLDPGNYVIKETSVPDGFKASASAIKFTVGSDYKITVDNVSTDQYQITSGNGTYDVNVTAYNIFTNKIVITKMFTDVNGNLVDDATLYELRDDTAFMLYNNEGAPQTSKISYAPYLGTITVSDLNAGTYFIRETVTPIGYEAAAEIQLNVASDGKITADYLGTRSDFTSVYGNGTTNVSATLYNRKKENQLVIQKKYYMADGVTEIPISQINQFASFELTMADGSPCNAEVTVSPRTGKYTFKNLTAGSYKITETAATGYITAGYIDFTVDIYGNIKVTSPLPSGWQNLSGDNTAHVNVDVNNSRVPNKLQLKKYYYDAQGTEVHPDDTILGNIAQFKLKDISGNEYPLNYDTTTGLYSVVNVPSGTYSLVETAPAGYKASGVIAVVVAEAGTISASYSGTTASDFAITGSGTTDNAFIVYKNHQVSNSITINKSYVSATGKKLDISSDLTDEEYAEFKLYKDYGKSYQTEITGARVSANKALGTYTFMNLDVGEYTIVENAGVSFEAYRDITFSVYTDKTIHNLSENELAQSDDFNKEIKVENVRKSYTNSFKLNKSFVDAEGNVVTDSAVYENLINNTSFVIADAYGNEAPVTYDTNIQAFVVENLEPGYYLIKEKTSPNNYIPAADIGLQVVKASPVSTIINVRYNGMLSDIDITDDATATPSAVLRNYSVKNIYISKRTLSGADELAGAVLSITDVTDNTVIEGWVSGTVEHRITVNKFVKNKVYKLQEIMAPFGYERIEPIYFMINNNDEVLVSDSESGTYTVVADNLIIVRDADKKINISKVDYEDASMLLGARLIIKDASQNTVDSEWISGDTPHELSMSLFEAGQVYTLTELSAPNGYDVAAPIKFKLDTDGNIFVYNDDTDAYEMISGNGIVMKDKKSDVSSVTETTTEATTEETTEEITETTTEITTEATTGSHVTTDGPKTGDKTPLAVIFTIFVISMVGVAVLVKKRKNI